MTQLRLTRSQAHVYVSIILDNPLIPLPKPPRRRALDTKSGPAPNEAEEKKEPPGCARLPLPLPLPFVVDGGVDSSWPDGDLQSVELLGADQSTANLAVRFTLDSHGLRLTGLPSDCLPSAIKHVAVLKLTYNTASLQW